MTIKTGILRSAGLAKESVLGTLVTTPDVYIPYRPPLAFNPDITLLESSAIRAQADKIIQADQGPSLLKGGKVQWEANPENIGEHLMAAFGTDTITEGAAFAVTSANKRIDFTEDGGSEVTAVLVEGSYAMGASSAVAGSLCAQIKTQMEAVNGASTYTVTYSFTTKKLTITKSAGVFVLKWQSGTNTATSSKTLLGFTNADTSSAIAATSDSTTASFVMAHAFTRVASELLPTYSWWIDSGNKYQQFAGCMLNKLEFTAKAKEYVLADAEWHGLSYDDTGSSKSPSYSTQRAFVFQDATLLMDAAQVYDYDNLKVTIENDVEVMHALSASKYGRLIYSKGLMVTVTADFYFVDTTQYAKFLAGTTAALNLTLTGATIANSLPYKLVLDLPEIQYRAAPLHNPQGPIKVTFAAVAKYNVSAAYTMKATLTNVKGAAY